MQEVGEINSLFFLCFSSENLEFSENSEKIRKPAQFAFPKKSALAKSLPRKKRFILPDSTEKAPQ